MLSQLIVQALLTLICTMAGIHFYLLFQKKTNHPKKPYIFYPITGLIFITLICQAVALFGPVNEYCFCAIVMLLILLTFIRRKEIKTLLEHFVEKSRMLPRNAVWLILVLWVMIAVFAAGPTIMDDTESYHMQMVKWIHEYGTVPGIANLHERFGFNSSWFSAISLFLPVFKNLNFYTSLNATISLWWSAFLITTIASSVPIKNANRYPAFPLAATFIFLLSLICWPLIRGNASSANYDFITTFLTVVLFISQWQFKKEGEFAFPMEWFLWPLYLFTIRIINFPLLLLSLYAAGVLARNKKWREVLLYIFLSVFLILPFLIRNILLSGYPFFPSMQFDVFNVDWKADDQSVRKLLDYIKYYNRVSTAFTDIKETQKLDFPYWTGPWFTHLFTYDKLLFFLGLPGYFISFISSKGFKAFTSASRFLVAVLFLHLLSWFFIAPDPRFVYGNLLCGCFLLFSSYPKRLNYTKVHANYLFMLLMGFVFVYTLFKVKQDKNYQNLVVPYVIPQPPTKKVVLGALILNIPEKIFTNWNPRCYATELPCLYILNPKLRLRGSTIKEGFRLEK